jgi:hypothetical protein
MADLLTDTATTTWQTLPTALVGEYLLTDHVAPAVIIYNSVTAVQAVSWILVTGTALRLTKDVEVRRARTRRPSKWLLCVTTMLWAYWLTFSLRAD